MAQKTILKLTGTIAGQIIYYILLSYAWMLLGWDAHFLGWIATIVACAVNPLLCAYLANHFTSVRKKLNIVVIWLVLLCLVLVCPPLSNTIWLHASGYYSHYSNPNDFLSETIAINQFLDMIGMVICGIIYITSFAIWRTRGKKRRLRD